MTLTSGPSCVPIAIVGVAAELPAGANAAQNLDFVSFAKFLFDKCESYEKIPSERFNIEYLRGNGLGHVVPDTGSFLKGLNLFDYLEFGITGRDAHLLPLSTRKLIETTFLSLLDSGIDYRGKNVGCYMSGVAHDIFTISGHDDAEAKASLAYAPSTLANRISYHLDLRGPTVPVDTACSSSLYATHLAVQALRNEECDAAVVGGCQLNHRFAEWLSYSQVTGVLSPDGKCKPFDESANGFSRSEGIVSIVLKPLKSALRDGDKIYGSILGTGVNSSGGLAPLHAPVAAAQMEAMQRAFRQAQRSPREVDFIESHTTGTAQGDPTEVNWIGAEFSREDELVMGSLKGNMGHLEIASFLGSLCKVCWIFKTGIIPPNVNLKNRNKAIKWDQYRIRVPTEPEPLKCRAPSGQPLIAMTSSGIGGANGHCVVAGPPARNIEAKTFWRVDLSEVPGVLLAGGLSPRSAKAIGDALKETYADEVRHQLTRLYGRRARSMPWRSFAVAKDCKVLNFSEPVLARKSSPPLVFVFSGQGPQYFDMGRELFKTNAVFHSTILELDEVYGKAVGQSLIKSTGIFSETPQEDTLGEIWPIAITLPALTMLQLALFDTLVALGIKPNIVIGHSAGETTVLHASGSGSKALALELAIARGKAMSLLEASDGTMAAVSCSEEQAREIIASLVSEAGSNPLEIGCYNTPRAVTLSGKTSYIDLAVQAAEAKGIFARRLRTRIPVHSEMMDMCRDKYQRLVGDVFSRYCVEQPSASIYSTKSGNAFGQMLDAQYFWDNTRGPVRFAEGVAALHARHPNAIYIEVGPHPVLSGYLSSIVGKDVPVLCPLRRPDKGKAAVELQGLIEFVGKLVVAGYHRVDFDLLSRCYTEAELPQIPYPFARRDVPYVANTREITRQRQRRNGPLNYLQLQVNEKTHPALVGHVIKDEPIMPAAGYLEMALEFGARKIWEVEFISIMALSSERPIPVDIKFDGYGWTVRSAAPSDIAKQWPLQHKRLHAKGYLSMDRVDERFSPIDLEPIFRRLYPIDMKNFYDGFAGFARYGPLYQRATACHRGLDSQGREEVLVQVRGNEIDIPDLDEYRLHPAILDSALHVMVHPMLTCCWDKARYYLPAKLGALTAHDALFEKKPFPKTVFSHGIMSDWSPDSITYDFEIVREDGVRLITIESIQVALHGHIPEKVGQRFEVADVSTGIKLPHIVANGHRQMNGYVHDTEKPANAIVITYARGTEIEIQKQLVALDTVARLSLWFVASAGLDGAALLGFSRSLRKEYGSWSVRAVVFPLSWSHEERKTAIDVLMHSECEDELYVEDNGVVHVPRIMLSTPPASSAAFQSNLPWVYDGSHVKQISVPSVPRNHVFINVTAASQVTSHLWSFLGQPAGESRSVAGIISGPISNIAIAHYGSICDINPSSDLSVFSLAVAVLAIGSGNFIHPQRIQGITIFVTHGETHVGRPIIAVYKHLGLRVISCPAEPTLVDLESLTAIQPTFIISGCEDMRDIQLFDDHVPPEGKVFPWSDVKRGIPGLLLTEPWAVGDALKLALVNRSVPTTVYVPPLKLIQDNIPGEVALDIRILSPDKVYLLIGGVGSLGMEIALWMYSQGARNIVLTSRGGRASITERGSVLSRRILKYLDRLPGLSLQAVAADAVSLKDIRYIVKNLHKPLGGCIILSAMLIDRTFTAQTAETFEAPFPPKVGAFQIFEQAVDVASLDFLITFSSVSAMFGNGGQTNYASANTALAGLTKKYKNAFCMVCPAIVDSAISLKADADDGYRRRLRHLTDWGMTGSELCMYIGDGIRKLRDGTIWQYVPNFDWSRVAANIGSSPVFQHLLPEMSAVSSEQTQETSSIKDIICKVLEIAPDDLAPDVPLRAYGLDSLSATSLSAALSRLISVSQMQLLGDVTLETLQVRADNAALNGAGELRRSEPEDETHELLTMVDEFSIDLPTIQPMAVDTHGTADKTILITGTRGSVGAHMLARLLPLPGIRKIFAFLRKSELKPSPEERQGIAFKSRGLEPAVLSSSILEVVEGDLSQLNLGLSKDMYDRIRGTLTHVVHIGWNVNLLAPLKAFEPDVRGLRALIDLAAAASGGKPAKFLYASTSGIFHLQYIPDSQSGILESLLSDPRVPMNQGYSASKWVSEQLLSIAMEKIPNFTATTVRIDQLSGGLNGAWNVSEWFPSIVAASAALGCFPDRSYTVSWLPVDMAAAAMVEMLDCPSLVLNLRHPKPIQWSVLATAVARALGVPLIPYTDWLARLEDEAKVADIRSISPFLQPAIRLIGIYRSKAAEVHGKHPLMLIDRAVEACPSLHAAALPEVQADVVKWIDYWRRVGALPVNQ